MNESVTLDVLKDYFDYEIAKLIYQLIPKNKMSDVDEICNNYDPITKKIFNLHVNQDRIIEMVKKLDSIGFNKFQKEIFNASYNNLIKKLSQNNQYQLEFDIYQIDGKVKNVNLKDHPTDINYDFVKESYDYNDISGKSCYWVNDGSMNFGFGYFDGSPQINNSMLYGLPEILLYVVNFLGKDLNDFKGPKLRSNNNIIEPSNYSPIIIDSVYCSSFFKFVIGERWKEYNSEPIGKYMKNIDNPKKIKVLAIACPELWLHLSVKYTEKQIIELFIKDLCYNLYYSFKLIRNTNGKNKIRINTLKIGKDSNHSNYKTNSASIICQIVMCIMFGFELTIWGTETIDNDKSRTNTFISDIKQLIIDKIKTNKKITIEELATIIHKYYYDNYLNLKLSFNTPPK